MATGRNDACPCGSGKKHKKCCLGKAEPLSVEPGYASARQVAAQKPIMGEAISPYSVIKLMERAAGSEIVWTRARVADMATENIESQLLSFGVAHRRERFLEQSRTARSAWAVSEFWFAEDPVSCKAPDEDFLGLAACELWKRLLSERPSTEMADDWIEEGYSLQKSDPAAACRVWWRAWSALRPAFESAMTTMDSTISAFNGMYLLSNWCEAFREALEADPDSGSLRHAFCSEWLEQFSGEDSNMRLRFEAGARS